MGVYSGNDVDAAGSAEVTLYTAAGTELLGQQTSAASVPVVIASNQSAIPISAASLPLPTGAATQATLVTVETDLTIINANLTNGNQIVKGMPAAVGQTTMAASLPVVIASNQSSVPTSSIAEGVVGTNGSTTAVVTAGKNISGNITAVFTDPAGRVFVSLTDGSGNALQSTGGSLNIDLQDANLAVTAVAATGVAVTLTLPAVAAQFVHVNTLEIQAYSTAARTGSATPITVTSTGLPGTPAWTFATAAAIGTTDMKNYVYQSPLRATAVNTAVTVVCPATTGIIWRINATYYTAV